MVYLGDCLDIMRSLSTVDLVFTSPPYAERRKRTYGGIPEEKYVEWFLPRAEEIKRILSPTGSFFLNIKPHTKDGERSLYVFDLILALKRELGFRFVDELCWTKNAFPGALKGRFKNAFEPVYHFTLSPDFKFNPLACGTPIKDETYARARRKQSGLPVNGSGMAALNGKKLLNLNLARPSNVINVNNVSNQFGLKQKHSATFPEGLVEFFVKSFSDEGDTVIDPFCGSGTVGVVCQKLNRNFILIDNNEENYFLSKERLKVTS